MSATPVPYDALTAALSLAAEGCSIFPCFYGTKEPAIRRGFYSASTNPATIRRWFGGTVNYNLAVRTGMASGIWVLDIDRRHGGDKSLAELEREQGALPPTRTVKRGEPRSDWAPAGAAGAAGGGRTLPLSWVRRSWFPLDGSRGYRLVWRVGGWINPVVAQLPDQRPPRVLRAVAAGAVSAANRRRLRNIGEPSMASRLSSLLATRSGASGRAGPGVGD
jgi:hypothetical protein